MFDKIVAIKEIEMSVSSFDLMYQPVKIVMDRLSDTQVAGLNLTIALENDPRNLPYWGDVSSLFDSVDRNGKPVMHDVTKHVCVSITNNRLR